MIDLKNQKNVRIIVLVVIGALTLFTLVQWFFNYRTLENALAAAEAVAESQSRNFQYYLQEYRIANQKVIELTEELQTANLELTAARNEISSVQGLNDQLRQSIDILERYKVKASAKGEALEAMIDAFKKKNRELDAGLQLVRKELASFQPDIADVKEGKEKVIRFKDQIRLVKKNMVLLKQQAMVMKQAAQEQHDRLETLYGNNGYMMKDGKDQSNKRQGAKVDIKVEFK